MTRSLGIVAAAAMALGLGGGLSRMPSSLADEARDRENDEMARRAAARRAARQQSERERRRQAEADLQLLRAGFEPSTGSPLSRQRRRALQRVGFKFDDGGVQ
jgi:hypothetical protein